MDYPIFDNKDHSVLVQRLNGFDRARATRWSRSIFTHMGWIVGLNLFNMLLGVGALVAVGFRTDWVVLNVVFCIPVLLTVVGWRHEVKKMGRPEEVAQQREDLRKTIMTAHSLIPNILPVLQSIDKHINTADVVWLMFVQKALNDYLETYEKTGAINMHAYEHAIGGESAVGVECGIMPQAWASAAVDSGVKSVM